MNQGDLFAPATHEREIDRLVPLARELAAHRADGVTVADLREAAVRRGLLTGEEHGRALSYLGIVMKRAGLRRGETYRRSQVARSHGNPHRVWFAS